MKLFGKDNNQSLTGRIEHAIRSEALAMGGALTSPQVARSLGMESVDSAMTGEINTAVRNLESVIRGVAANHNVQLTVAQEQAGVIAGMLAADPLTAFARKSAAPASTDGMAVVSVQPADAVGRMREALEAYDEKDNRNLVSFSVAYNMQAARQDEFGEAFFPTVVLSPDQNGMLVSIKLIQVYDEVRRQTSGALDRFNKRNILQALIDPSILKNDQTDIVPVYHDGSKEHFVDSTLVAPYTVLLDNEAITTAPLAMRAKFSLLGISETQALLETGLLDSTDSIDTSITLKSLYIKLKTADKTEVLKFNTDRLPTAVFTQALQGNYRLMQLAFTNDALLVNENTRTVAGTESQILKPIVDGKYYVRLATQVSGSVNLELADTELFAGGLSVASITDSSKNVLDLKSGSGRDLASIFATAEVIGYELSARRTNLNKRQRGQLLDVTYYQQHYTVELRAPITIPRPLTVGGENDSSDLAALVTTTHIRTSNAAVDELLATADFLEDFVHNKDGLGRTPEILGVTRFLLTPWFERKTLNVDEAVDSLRSFDRTNDIQALLVNELRDMAYRMYRDSGYKAAADGLAGGIAPIPTIIVGTDQYIVRYLLVAGDFRTLGNDFNIKVVSTQNQRMRGKLIMALGDFSTGTEGAVNPLHFGNMAWKPELTAVLPIHRNGANNKELTVQPSFKHIVNTPVMGVLEVSGITEVVASKVAIKLAQ